MGWPFLMGNVWLRGPEIVVAVERSSTYNK
jgi:hypothetical protein